MTQQVCGGASCACHTVAMIFVGEQAGRECHLATTQELAEELAKLQAEVRDAEQHRRQIEESIAYRRSLREEKELRAQIDEVQPVARGSAGPRLGRPERGAWEG